MSDALVLFRCRTPTNFLCPCGAAARKLSALGLEHRTERVPYRRSERPEIVELTGQERVPVLVDGKEVVHDSKRIVEYLEHVHGGAGERAGEAKGPSDEGSRMDADGNA
jgi:glutathione S-transferase